jgi:hypothetical protein
VRVELLADFQAAAHAAFPPPRGGDAGEALLNEGRSAVGEKLVEPFGHGPFIPAVGLRAGPGYSTIEREGGIRCFS